MICVKCGKEIEVGQHFCPNCGAPVPNQDTEVQNADFIEDTVQNIPVETKVSILDRIKTDRQFQLMNGSLLLIIISSILPFFKVSLLGTSISYTYLDSGDGSIIVPICIVTIIITLFNKKILNIISRVSGLFIAIIACVDILNFHDVNAQYYNLCTKSIGYYLLIIAVIGLLAGCLGDLIYKAINKKK